MHGYGLIRPHCSFVHSIIAYRYDYSLRLDAHLGNCISLQVSKVRSFLLGTYSAKPYFVLYWIKISSIFLCTLVPQLARIHHLKMKVCGGDTVDLLRKSRTKSWIMRLPVAS